MNPLVPFLLAGGAAIAVARSVRRTAGKFKWSGERTYDDYWLPDNVSISGATRLMNGPAEAPAQTTASVQISTRLALVGTWEDAAEEWGLLGQVINPAALANPDTEFWVHVAGPEDQEYVQAEVDGHVPLDMPGWAMQDGYNKTVELLVMVKTAAYVAGDVPHELDSQEAVALWMQHGLTAIIHGQNFDWEGNGVWIPEDCWSVFIGKRFWTDMAMEAPTLAEALAIPGNSALGYADYLYSQGVTDPKAMATLIIQQIAEHCAQWGEYDEWLPPIHDFHEWLQRLIYEDVLGINFPGG